MEKEITELTLQNFYISTGLIMRCQKDSEVIGYINDSPKNVLRKILPNHHITQYKNLALFSSGDFFEDTPLVGLGVLPYTPKNIYGLNYNGNLEEFLKLGRANKALRTIPFQKNQKERIERYLTKEDDCFSIIKQDERIKNQKKELVEILNEIF